MDRYPSYGKPCQLAKRAEARSPRMSSTATSPVTEILNYFGGALAKIVRHGIY